MAPSLLSSGAAACVVAVVTYGACGGEAYAPPATATRSFGRSRAGALAASASNFGGDEPRTTKKSQPPSPIGTSSDSPYIRIQKRGRHYDVQTAITTFRKASKTVDLHAQIHFGDASYFQYFNDDEAFASRYDNVLYELIVEDRFLKASKASNEMKQLMSHEPGSTLNPIAPTPADRNTASQYGLQCQVDGIQYCREGWVHADLTREEFLGCLEQGEKQKQKHQQSTTRATDQPLWALASTAATYPGSELVVSLMRPLTTKSNSASAALTRRLFTHLFLPGDALSGWIRAILWFGVPSPELSIMLVDWSSLSYIGRQTRRRGSSNKEDGDSNIAPISPIAAPVMLSLLTGNWGTARRLVFGQILVGGQSSADTSKGGVLIDKRNERAVEVLRTTMEQGEDSDEERKDRIALLYGAGHCRDLQRRLVQEEGLVPIRTEWRTAFRATAPRWGDFVDMDDWRAKSKDLVSTTLPSSMDGEGIVKSMSVSTLESVAVGLVILPLYLVVGGFDWVSTMGDLGNALDGGMYLDGIASLLLYLVRHVALYVGISKFVVDWGGSEGVFEDDEV